MRRRQLSAGLLALTCVAGIAVTATFVGAGAFAAVSHRTSAQPANDQPLTPAQKRAAAKKAAAKRAAVAKRKRLAARRAAAARAAAARRAYNKPAAVYARGLTLFKRNCSHCHSLAVANAHGHVGPDLNGAAISYSDALYTITNGNSLMPGFGGTLTTAQIKDLATFVSKATA